METGATTAPTNLILTVTGTAALDGAVRIASTSFGTTGWNGQIMDVAFSNPDGSTALVVHNENDDPRSFTVAAGGRTFDYTLPGGSLATFTWPRGRVFDDGLRLLSLKGATATSLPGSGQAVTFEGSASGRRSDGASV